MRYISEYVSDIIASAEKTKKLKGGIEHNFKETVDRINKYTNNEYYERQSDAIFWNLSNTRVINFAKSIDLDTKDYRPEGQGDINFIQSWILRIKFKKWMRDARIAILLNDLSEGLGIYGSIIWKLVNGDNGKELQECDLTNIYFDTLTKDLRSTPKVEMHHLTRYEVEERADVWKKTDEVLTNQAESNDPFEKIDIWEFWGPWGELGKKSKYYHCIGYGQGAGEVKLFEEYVSKKDDPYYDFHIGRYRGRWMRVGVVERLFHLQERANQIVNENASSTAIASLLLLRSSDPSTAGANVLDQAVTGQIIQSSDLQQIGIDNRTLQNFLNEMNLIESTADKLCHTPEIIQGETMPSGTPFKGMAVIERAAKSTFAYIKQRVGETITYLMMEEILPSIAKQWNSGEILDIAEDEGDIEVYNEYIARLARIHAMNDASSRGEVMMPENADAFAQQHLDTIRSRKLEVPKKFFNFDYGIIINATGESIDKSQQNDAYANALGMLQQNPAIIDAPLFKQYLENNGISYFKMSKYLKEQMKQSAQAMVGVPGKASQPSPIPSQGL